MSESVAALGGGFAQEPPPAPTPAPLFDATLRPHRSLTPLSFWMILGAFGAVSFGVGTLFLIQGAWPVFGFYGLDVALLFWAFRASSRGAKLFERLELTPESLTVRRVNPKGQETRWEFQPYWLKLDLEELAGGGNRLTLRSHGRVLEIGAFLAPDEKAGLAEALGAALRTARTPALYPPSTSFIA